MNHYKISATISPFLLPDLVLNDIDNSQDLALQRDTVFYGDIYTSLYDSSRVFQEVWLIPIKSLLDAEVFLYHWEVFCTTAIGYWIHNGTQYTYSLLAGLKPLFYQICRKLEAHLSLPESIINIIKLNIIIVFTRPLNPPLPYYGQL